MKLLKVFLALVVLAPASLIAEFDHSHSAFTEILKENVSGDSVNYPALKKSPEDLVSYLGSLSKVSQSEFKDWNDDQQKAFLINLYNAATLRLIIDNYPLKSINDIGSPWKKNIVLLFGYSRSLDYIEHEILRKNYNDPRIHFGVNCASIGCPSLRAEAFQAEKLDTQLDEQASKFLQDTSKNKVDTKSKTLYLSSIFDWFKGDFVKKSGSVEKFIAPYLKEPESKAVSSGSWKIKYNDYNWNLNK